MLSLITTTTLSFPKYCFQQVSPIQRPLMASHVLPHRVKLSYQFCLSLALKAYNLVLLPNKPDFPELLTAIPVTFCCPTKTHALFAIVSIWCLYLPFSPTNTFPFNCLVWFTIYYVPRTETHIHSYILLENFKNWLDLLSSSYTIDLIVWIEFSSTWICSSLVFCFTYLVFCGGSLCTPERGF